MTREELRDYVDEQRTLDIIPYHVYSALIDGIDTLEQEPNTGHCEDCKYFRKLPLRTDTIGKCIQHWGVCPPCDWYCADFEPQERSE